MAKYQAGEETKQKILKVSKTFFYEKGYEETLYNDIAGAANVNRALIPYHYKKKSDLALAVYDSFIEEYIYTREQISKGYSPEEKLVIGVLYYYRLLENENVSRFINFVINEKSYQERLVWGEGVMYEKIIPSKKKYTQKQWQMIVHMIWGMENETVKMIYQKLYTDIREMGEVMIHMVFQYLGYSASNAEQIFHKANKILDNYQYEINSSFEIKIIEK